jgi:hypothetical protein
METIYKNRYGGGYHTSIKDIHKIYIYNETGVIHTISTSLKEVNDEEVEQFNVLQILNIDKSFRKPETEQEFINKQMKKKINFSYLSEKKDHWTKEHEIELFLYVDGEFLKVVEQKDRTEVRPMDYDFSREYSYYNDIILDFDGQIIKHSESTDYKVIADEELQKQAKELFDEIYRISYIQQSEFNRIFNKYNIVKRDMPLLTK